MSFVSRETSEMRLALLKLLRCLFCPMCGERKDPGKCFDRTCYFGLDQSLRNLLYTPIDAGDGEFEEYYLKAMKHLRNKGFHRKLSEWKPDAVKAIKATGLLEVLKARKEKERLEHGL
jgi:hypothetical protein